MQATYPVHMTHEIDGDVEVSYDGPGIIDVSEILGGSHPQGTSFLSVSVGQGGIMNTSQSGSNQPPSADDILLRWSADLVPGLYTGPGTYTIDRETRPTLTDESGLRSAAYISVIGPPAGEDILLPYNELVEPCTLTYEAEAVRGRVECPALGLEGRSERTVSWTWTWERLSERTVDQDRDYWTRFLPAESPTPEP